MKFRRMHLVLEVILEVMTLLTYADPISFTQSQQKNMHTQ